MRRMVIGSVGFAIATAAVAGAQEQRLWEIRPLVGVSIPLGSQRDAFKEAFFTGGEAALRVRPTVDLLTSITFQAANSKYPVTTTTASVWVFDVGFEKRFRDSVTDDVKLIPFLGGGVGGRAYDFDSGQLLSRTCYAGYGAAGLALEWNGAALRGEARDNLFCYESPVPGISARTGNELALSLGLGFRF